MLLVPDPPTTPPPLSFPDPAARLEPSAEPWLANLIGRSPGIQRLAAAIQLIRNRRCTVLITGETGTGKEVVARAIHNAGDRARHPFVAVNCSALPENLLEAELFGHERGAFTGAFQRRIGRFEQAHRGTVFLDEIGDMPLELQTKLLRVLQEREIQRLGGGEIVNVDVRVIAATNANLLRRVSEGEFREDLFYRLNVVPVRVPPLRERLCDIPLLATHFVEKVCRHEGLPVKTLSPGALYDLARYSWPGNVRQLEHAIEMAVILSGDREELLPPDFDLPVEDDRRPAAHAGPHRILVPDHGIDFEAIVNGIELDLIRQALRRTNGNKKMAADLLRLKRTTLTAKIKSLEGLHAVASSGA
jgi:transcriptional regulator with GAF, ATPase, and Fis domain